MLKTSIKAAVITLFVLFSFSISAQRKSEIQDLGELRKINDALTQIYVLKETYHDIYMQSVSWVHVYSNSDAKKELDNYIDFEYNRVKKIVTYNSASSFTPSMRAKLQLAFQKLDKLITAAAENRQELRDFEDYDDDIKRQNGAKVITETITPLYYEIDSIANNILVENQARFTSALSKLENSVSPKQKKSTNSNTVDIAEFESAYNTLSNFYHYQEVNIKAHIGVINWVYREEDTYSRNLLRQTVESLSEVITSLSYEKENEIIFSERLTLDTLTYNFERLNKKVRDIMLTLNTPEQYEDPLTKLLSEDDVISYLSPLYEWIDYDLFRNVTRRKLRFKNLLASSRDKKLQTIRWILEYNYPNMENSILEGVEKLKAQGTENKFNKNDLIEAMIPIYDESFTEDEIRDIFEFQRSKVGRKLRKKSIFLTVETEQIIKLYFESLGVK